MKTQEYPYQESGRVQRTLRMLSTLLFSLLACFALACDHRISKTENEIYDTILNDQIVSLLDVSDSLSGNFTVIYVDTMFLCEYNFYRLKSQEGVAFMLLSEKHSDERLPAEFGEHETIRDGNTYDLTLTEFDSLLIIEQCFIRSYIYAYLVFDEYYDDKLPSGTEIEFWRQDTICTKAYWSPQVHDKYYVGQDYLVPGVERAIEAPTR